MFGFCTEVLARADMGAFLQHCFFHHWHLHQRSYEEEEACGFEAKGTDSSSRFTYHS